MQDKKIERTKLQSVWSWLKRRNWTDFIAALALLVGSISLWLQATPPAPRARFTVFLDNPAMWRSPFWENATEIDLTGNMINEGSLVGEILRWGVFIAVNVSYTTLLDRYQMPTNPLLSPTDRANFTMQTTLIGQNDTRLPDNAIRSCTVWVEYKYHLTDNSVVIQTAEDQVSYLP